MDNLTLLTELGLADTNLVDSDFGDFQTGIGVQKDYGNDVDDVFDKLLSELNVGD